MSGIVVHTILSFVQCKLDQFSIALCVISRLPTLKSIRDLLFKRGFGTVDGKRKALTDNVYIEKMLGNVLALFIQISN